MLPRVGEHGQNDHHLQEPAERRPGSPGARLREVVLEEMDESPFPSRSCQSCLPTICHVSNESRAGDVMHGSTAEARQAAISWSTGIELASDHKGSRMPRQIGKGVLNKKLQEMPDQVPSQNGPGSHPIFRPFPGPHLGLTEELSMH